MNKYLRKMAMLPALILLFILVASAPVKAGGKKDETVVLRVCNWEEYIDKGDWDEDEAIDLESSEILGVNSMVNDFETWYYENYGVKVKVEYSCFGTNEDLYSQLTLGDTYDLVCPSDYMIMKLMSEDMLEPLSEDFFDENNSNNYYIKGVSPYIRDVFEENQINGEAWSKYAAGYMWGTTGFIYNPEEVTEQEASTWNLLSNTKFYRQITIKDNVRDAYFPTLAIINADKLLSQDFRNQDDYREQLTKIMNDTDDSMIETAEAKLKEIKNNVYSFETDSGKADMVTGKVVASLQWSGDAVYAMDQAEEDDMYLDWAVPEECTNLWFDGWVMLKNGINGNAEKKQVAQAFINFLSRPDNAVRNMYYIGYTSTISGGEDPTIFEYVNWLYGADDEETDTAEYLLGYFFSGDNEDENYMVLTSEEQTHRQLYAQYPTQDVISRSAVMQYFDSDSNVKINQMWINIRCFNLSQITPKGWTITGIVTVVIVAGILLVVYRRKIFK